MGGEVVMEFKIMVALGKEIKVSGRRAMLTGMIAYHYFFDKILTFCKILILLKYGKFLGLLDSGELRYFQMQLWYNNLG